MAEDILKAAREDVSHAEEQLKAAKVLIERLKKAGEDTLELERRYSETKRRLDRFKRAFVEG